MIIGRLTRGVILVFSLFIIEAVIFILLYKIANADQTIMQFGTLLSVALVLLFGPALLAAVFPKFFGHASFKTTSKLTSFRIAILLAGLLLILFLLFYAMVALEPDGKGALVIALVTAALLIILVHLVEQKWIKPDQ